MNLSPLEGLAPVRAGDILAGKFRVERVLGVGGMGVVVAAMHLQLDQRVALKFVLPSAIQNAETVERFSREARAAVRLRSEHVARVLDVGTLESGSPYIVMEFLEGRDLAEVIAPGPLSVRDAVDYVMQACEAIAEAHSIGIVHRDLKPRNLFLARRIDGRPLIKVLDFGISKMTVPGSPEQMSLTRTTEVMGSPNYMSPEQLRSARNVDLRTDIWSLGVILYEILTGHVPFEAETVTQLCAMVLQDTPRVLHEYRPDLPPALTDVVFRCLEKDPARRFQSVAELAHALEPFGAAETGAAARIGHVATRISGAPALSDSSGARVAVTGGTSVSWGETELASKRTSRAPLALGAAFIAMVLGGGAWLALHKAPPVPLPPTATTSDPPIATTAAPSANAASTIASGPPSSPSSPSSPSAPSSAVATASNVPSVTPSAQAARVPNPVKRPPPQPRPTSHPIASPTATDEMPNERH